MRTVTIWDTAKRQSSDSNVIYVVPLSHLKTVMQGRINIIISLNRKIFNYYDYSIHYCTGKFTLKLIVTQLSYVAPPSE